MKMVPSVFTVLALILPCPAIAAPETPMTLKGVQTVDRAAAADLKERRYR